MQPELLELLQEAKGDAPPLRYDVDDAVAAGRRLRRRRTTGWAVAAVVAVVAAIGVPQIVTRGSAPPVQPARPIANSPAPGSPVTFTFPFDQFEAGEYSVTPPLTADIAAVTARVSRTDEVIPAFDGATLRVYRPGLDPMAGYPGAVVTETEPVKGRRAFFFKQDRSRDILGLDHFGWEYADRAVAILEPETSGMPRENMRQVAEAFTLRPAQPVVLPFKMGRAPSGYSVVETTRMGVRLIPTGIARQRMAEPDHGPTQAEEGHPNLTVSITLEIPGRTEAAGITCDTEGCHRRVEADARLTVKGLAEPEARRILASITLIDLGGPPSWLPVSAAVPASALLTHP